MSTEERLKEIEAKLNCDTGWATKGSVSWLITTLSRYIKADKVCVKTLEAIVKGEINYGKCPDVDPSHGDVICTADSDDMILWAEDCLAQRAQILEGEAK